MGRIRLGMTLDEARRTLGTAAVLTRTEDGDGAAFVAVMEGREHTMTLWANEDDPAAPIDWSRPIEYIDTFNDTFHTAAGVRPGALVEDVVRLFGPVTEIVVIEIDDVFDVRITSGRVILSSAPKIVRFTSRFSTTASTT